MLRWLIDGYNLLGAFGLMQGKLAPAGLEKNRLFLLDFLADRFGAQASAALVIFDAARAPARRPDELEHRGVHVRFAKGRPEADDLIEELLARVTRGSKLTLVSSDHRLQTAAQRRSVRVLDCEAFLDEIERLPRPARSAAPEKTAIGDTDYWLREFAGIEDEPGVRELFDRFGADQVDDAPT